MPPPQPLTRTPAPSLDFSRPGIPAATDFGDIYFSADGGLAETRAVFLDGCGLPDGWQGRDVFTVAELGFGSGLNFLATWQAWRESGATGRLHYVSVEGFPFERDDLARTLRTFPELADLAASLLRQWPGPVRGNHRRHFGNITLTLIHDEISAALSDQDFRADAWFLDGFSPAKNPDMWSDGVMTELARLSAPGARLATFTVAGAVRRALTDAGFDVKRKTGFGRKRHRLEARLPEAGPESGPKSGPEVLPISGPSSVSGAGLRARPADPPPTIIGAGIAGASVAQAFLRRGVVPTVIFDPDHPAASANPAALIKPRLDLQDQPTSRFFLSSFLYACEAYRDAVLHAGLTHRPRSDAEADRLRRISEQAPFGPGHLHWTGEALDMPSALTIDPEIARTVLLDGAHLQSGKIDDLSAVAGPIILAGGYGVRTLMPALAFRYARGQLSWTEGSLDQPVTYSGYAVPLGERILLGATHERIVDPVEAFAVRAEDDADNLARAIAQGLPVGPDVRSGRTSVRVNTADTLPRLFKTATKKPGQDVWVLSGLGSRGFVFAPLLGEALVSLYLGEPSALSRPVLDRFSRRPV